MSKLGNILYGDFGHTLEIPSELRTDQVAVRKWLRKEGLDRIYSTTLDAGTFNSRRVTFRRETSPNGERDYIPWASAETQDCIRCKNANWISVGHSCGKPN